MGVRAAGRSGRSPIRRWSDRQGSKPGRERSIWHPWSYHRLYVWLLDHEIQSMVAIQAMLYFCDRRIIFRGAGGWPGSIPKGRFGQEAIVGRSPGQGRYPGRDRD